MKTCLSTTALATALTIGLCVHGETHVGGMGGASASARATLDIHRHGFGFHHRFLPPANLFHRPHFRFGAGFRSHTVPVFAGGAGSFDNVGGDEDYEHGAGDDIENLHFRVQEPFGPGDIGRPPARGEGDGPNITERMDPSHGHVPDW